MGQKFNNFKNQFNDKISYENKGKLIMSKAYSWPVVIIFIVCFFPLGFYLLYRHFTVNKMPTSDNIKGLRNTGLILISVGVIYTIMGISGELDTSEGGSVVVGIVMMLGVFGGIGLKFLLTSIKMKHCGIRYKKYISLIVNQNEYMLDNIASSLGFTYDTTFVDIQEMLEIGYFPGSYVNEINREFVYPEKEQSQTNISENLQMKVITCKNCGASNTVIINQGNECEYCGSTIESYM